MAASDAAHICCRSASVAYSPSKSLKVPEIEGSCGDGEEYRLVEILNRYIFQKQDNFLPHLINDEQRFHIYRLIVMSFFRLREMIFSLY